jgi:hypothetical protein
LRKTETDSSLELAFNRKRPNEIISKDGLADTVIVFMITRVSISFFMLIAIEAALWSLQILDKCSSTDALGEHFSFAV